MENPFRAARARISAEMRAPVLTSSNIIENFSFKEFEGTINVADDKAEKKTDKFCPAEAVESAKEIILPIDAETTNDVKLLHKRK